MPVNPAFDGPSGRGGTTRPYGAGPGYRPVPGYGTGAGYGWAAWPARTLAADADRERAIGVLKASFTEGRLTKAEYDDRTARVYAARTYGELGALTADLPTGPIGGPAPYPAAGYLPWRPARPAVSPMAVAALACGIGEFFTMGLTAIPAVVLGHLARRQLRQTGQRGDGMALAGLILGWAGIALIAVAVAGLIAVTTAAAHGVHPVIGHPAPGSFGGPVAG